jgi:putative protease
MGMDKTALNVELGRFGQNVLTKRRSEYLKTMESNPKEAPRRGPQLGIDGCCGKGCNGCLIFAHDPAYAKARRVLAEKPIGEMFQHDMRE